MIRFSILSLLVAFRLAADTVSPCPWCDTVLVINDSDPQHVTFYGTGRALPDFSYFDATNTAYAAPALVPGLILNPGTGFYSRFSGKLSLGGGDLTAAGFGARGVLDATPVVGGISVTSFRQTVAQIDFTGFGSGIADSYHPVFKGEASVDISTQTRLSNWVNVWTGTGWDGYWGTSEIYPTLLAPDKTIGVVTDELGRPFGLWVVNNSIPELSPRITAFALILAAGFRVAYLKK